MVVLALSLVGLLVLVGIFIAVTEADHGSSAAVAQPEAGATPPAAVLPQDPALPSAGVAESDLQGALASAPASTPGATSGAAEITPKPPRTPLAATGRSAENADQAVGAAAPASSSPGETVSVSPADGTGVLLASTPGDGIDITKRTDWPPTNSRRAYLTWMLAHSGEAQKYLDAKWDRAQTILAIGNITHKRVLEAFLMTPREAFSRDPKRAYDNAALPIGWGQTISGPHMVSRMTDYLDPQPDQRVLEIGTGSGYQSAVLSELSNHVYTIEIVDPLARKTNAIYQSLEPRYPEYRNINRKIDDGYYGWPQHAPFDRIIVTCGIDHVPPELLRELAPEGIMVIPVGPPSGQTILRIIKHVAGDGTVTLDREDIFQGKRKQVFVPFTAKGGGVHSSSEGTSP